MSFAERVAHHAGALALAALLLLQLVTLTSYLGLAPSNLDVPAVYGGDGLSYGHTVQRILEAGDLDTNPRLGAPFGASLADYPTPEVLPILLVRTLSLVSDEYGTVYNLFLLIASLANAAAAYWACRRLGMGILASFGAAYAFANLPFFHLRPSHLFLEMYGAIPLVVGWSADAANRMSRDGRRPGLAALTVIVALIAGSTGAYYALFAGMIIAAAALERVVVTRQLREIRPHLVFLAILMLTFGVTLAPSVLHLVVEGANPAVAARQYWESEQYGLKLVQMILPTPGHSFEPFRAIAEGYQKNPILVNENATASLGLIGVAGLALILLRGLFRVETDVLPQGAFHARLAIGLTLFATVGGLAVVFALLVTPMFRGMNRMSIVIGFLAIVAAYAALEHAFRMRRSFWLGLLVVASIPFVAFDQLPQGVLPPREWNTIVFRDDEDFFEKAEAQLPAGSAVLVVPHLPFPESPALHREDHYAPMRGFLHTESLRFSYGAMRGRPGAGAIAEIASSPPEFLVEAAVRAGYGAIYVERLALTDNGAAVETAIAADVGPPVVVNGAATRAIYRLPIAAKGDAMVALGLGAGFHGWEPPAASLGFSWANQEATLDIGALGTGKVRAECEIGFGSIWPQRVILRERGRVLGSVEIRPGTVTRVRFELAFDAPQSRSVTLASDRPAANPGNGDPRLLSFNILHPRCVARH